MNNSRLSIFLYKLYVLALPFGKFVNIWFFDFLDKLFIQFSSIVMLIGILVLMRNGKLSFNGRTSMFLNLFVFMLVWSSLCALVFSFTAYSEKMNPVVRLLSEHYYFFLAVLSFVYNFYCLTYIVKFQSLYKIFDIQIVIIVIVGLFQFAALFGLSAPYIVLCQFFRLRSVDWLISVGRGVTLFGDEPSAISILCFLVVPYALTSISMSKGFLKIKYIIAVFFFGLFFIASLSTQTLLLFIALMLLYIVYVFWGKIPKNFYQISFLFGFFSVSVYLLGNLKSIDTDSDDNTLEYAVLAKVLDEKNASTVIRVSTIVNDLKIMGQYPLTGVGNGFQGYFYYENSPDWVKKVKGYDDFEKDRTIVNGGGNFFPSYFSGFGLVGVFFFLIFLKRYKSCYRTSFLQDDKRANVIYQMGTILFIFASWTVVDLRETQIFLLSLASIKSYNFSINGNSILS